MTELNQQCRICGNKADNQRHEAREMFVGKRQPFAYIECARCQTVQIEEVPDLTPFYASDYYSFQPVDTVSDARPFSRLRRSVGRFLRARAADRFMSTAGALSRAITEQLAHVAGGLFVGFPDYLQNVPLDLRVNRNSRVLDVGSGSGHTLLSLSHFGFRSLLGVDPFLPYSKQQLANVKLLRANLVDVTGRFDLILANHSVEHVPNTLGILQEIRRLLADQHYAIVRMPVLAAAWHIYGVDWVQLDAPRHLCLFTEQTFKRLAVTAGFEVEHVRYDSTAFQFWGSEQYRMDIPLLDERSYLRKPELSKFSEEEIRGFEQLASELNVRRQGDQAVFYLRRQ